MSTTGIIAVPYHKGWTGVYHYYDSYPDGLGVLLRRFANEKCGDRFSRFKKCFPENGEVSSSSPRIAGDWIYFVSPGEQDVVDISVSRIKYGLVIGFFSTLREAIVDYVENDCVDSYRPGMLKDFDNMNGWAFKKKLKTDLRMI